MRKYSCVLQNRAGFPDSCVRLTNKAANLPLAPQTSGSEGQYQHPPFRVLSWLRVGGHWPGWRSQRLRAASRLLCREPDEPIEGDAEFDRVIFPQGGYFKIGDRDDHREMRAKVLGRVLALDRALEPLLPPLLALLDVPIEDPGWEKLDPPAAPPTDARRRQAPAAAGEPGASAARGLRGPALGRRRDPGPARQSGTKPWLCPAPAPGQLTGPSMSTVGVARPRTLTSGSTACPPRARRSCWRRSSARTLTWRRSPRCWCSGATRSSWRRRYGRW